MLNNSKGLLTHTQKTFLKSQIELNPNLKFIVDQEGYMSERNKYDTYDLFYDVINDKNILKKMKGDYISKRVKK